MWAAHHPAALHWAHNSARGPCSLGGGGLRSGDRNHGGPGRTAGHAGLPLKSGSAVTSSSNVMLHRNSRIACPQEDIILVPVSLMSCMDMARSCSPMSGSAPLNLRFWLQQRWSFAQSSRSRASLGSPNDSAEVSEDGKEQEVPADSLEFTHKVALDVLAPPDLVWKLWTDIKSAPLWMRWIDRVDFLDDDDNTDSPQDLPPGLSRLSRWICSTIGFEVMWVARVEHVESSLPVRVLRWATVEGLPSRGEVTFEENNAKGTTVELSISHSLPAALGRVMQSSALRGFGPGHFTNRFGMLSEVCCRSCQSTA